MMVLLGVDPNLVRPGWTPLVVLILMGIVLFFLGRSMIKQFGKIDVPADHEPQGPADPAGDARTATDAAGSRPMPDIRHQTSGSGSAATAGERATPSDHA